VKSGRPVRPDAASVTAPTRFNTAWLASQLRALIGPLSGRQLCVAYSGGMDSGALLRALATLRSRERFGLRALHINHQLHPQAQRWARAAQGSARRLRVACKVIKVRIEQGGGNSLEAAAREARYRALAEHLAPGELLLTAHHQEDQLETVLLALARGSGVKGLCAMGAVTEWAGTLLLRPLLPISRAQLEQFARRRGVTWSEDPSNQDERFDRNYLRRVVLPLLKARWPAIAATATRSAANLAEASAMLEEMAHRSLENARDGSAVRVSVLRRLPLPQRRNALRQWIAEHGLPAPDQRRLREISGPLLAAREDAQAVVRWTGAELRRHADRLFLYDARTSRSGIPAVEIEHWDWRGHPWVSLGSGGTLGIVRDPHGDVQLKSLPAVLAVRYRVGGERLHGANGRAALKDLLQKQGLAPWERAKVPLILHAGRVVAVADLWLDQHYGIRDQSDAARGRFRWRRQAGDARRRLRGGARFDNLIARRH
jgi:tRNA(Ile)-lysidine synthase